MTEISDPLIERAMPEMPELVRAVAVVAEIPLGGDPEFNALVMLCRRIQQARGGLPLAELLRVWAR